MKTLVLTLLVSIALSPAAKAGTQSTNVTSEALYRALYGMMLNGSSAVKSKAAFKGDLYVVTLTVADGANTITCTHELTPTEDSSWFDCKTTDDLEKPARQ
ncbi:MAG: hypothetical protein V4760_17960 [Bdellovibrionota bacterium]